MPTTDVIPQSEAKRLVLNRICPICATKFPAQMRQEDFDAHVQQHFGGDVSQQKHFSADSSKLKILSKLARSKSESKEQVHNRRCPICATWFSPQMKQVDFDAHVQRHYMLQGKHSAADLSKFNAPSPLVSFKSDSEVKEQLLLIPNRTCPVCATKFLAQMAQQDFEDHVSNCFSQQDGVD